MIHFGFRALELTRTGGVVSMIFNDSIFTSADASDFRRTLLPDGEARIRVTVIARTRCFEGKAVNGGVVVAVRGSQAGRPIRYVENHGRPPVELAGASIVAESAESPVTVGRSELWVVECGHYVRLPHRPLFRPSPEALVLLDRFEECAAWDEFSRLTAEHGANWEMLSETRQFERWKEEQRSTGFYVRLRDRSFTLLGLVVEGGQGLATADDRRFVAAIRGTSEGERALANQGRFEALVLDRSEPACLYRDRRTAGRAVEDALLDVAERFTNRELGWLKTGLIRTADLADVVRRRLTPDEIHVGLASGPHFVPFEKGDDSVEDGGARWCRDNPLVIDWSVDSVGLLRRRARQEQAYRTPYFRNEHLWGRDAVTWNKVASYLRARIMLDGTIPSDGAFFMRPVEPWLSSLALLALLNASVADFAVRTFLVSRMNTEVGGLRRLPIPILKNSEAEHLASLAARAVAAKAALDRGEPSEPLAGIEAELDGYVRELYGIRRDADLWVVR